MGHGRHRPRLTDTRQALRVVVAIFSCLCLKVLFTRTSSVQGSSKDISGRCVARSRPIPLAPTRDELGAILQNEPDMHVGLELGVQRGLFAQTTLQRWKKCKKYILVDLWGQQTNYEDIANVDDAQQEAIYREARANLVGFKDRGVELQFMRMLTSEAVHRIENGTIDFLYIDARHDYCGVKEDIELYYPKVRAGGIIAGHDYVQEATWREGGQDWSICQDGSRHPLAVMGAVNEFAANHDLQVSVTPFDKWHSWIIRKPEIVCI